MTGKNDRRCYRREQLRLPLQISWKEERRAPVPAWMLDASPGGLLLELPEPIRLSGENLLSLSLLSGENPCYKLGAGVIRHREPSSEDGGQILGVQLSRENPLLFCASMLGASPGMLEIKSLLPQIAASNLNILIRGETGAGKNVLAKTIHDICRGPEQPFIRVNCPSIPDSLFESELFGHEKGAFTDAKTSAPGYFRLAAGGTILLDEISEIQPHLQAKLLRVIEDKHFMPVGGQKLVPVRANIIATSNVDLETAVEEGRFRRDLFYRLCEMPLHLPSLCERKEDVALLAHYFLLNYCEQFHRPFKTLSPVEIALLENHTWPGNVRELENYMKQTALLGKFVGPQKSATQDQMKCGNFLQTVGFPDDLLDEKSTLTELTKRLTAHVERTIILRALDACNQNRTRAADRLGISYRTLLRKLDQYEARNVTDFSVHLN